LRSSLRRGPTFSIGVATAALSAALALPLEGQPSADWPLHNLDLGNSRYAPHDEINPSNVASLALRWKFDMPSKEVIASMTPLVVDGVMYFNAGSKLYAVNAATGETLWTYALGHAFGGGGRGPAYGDGKIYAFGSTIVYAVDAKTGKAVDTFGDNGALPIVARALAFKYPGKYPPNVNAQALGYQLTTPPTYYGGTLFVGTPFSENLIRGGLLIAADGKTGAIKWVFNTVPQRAEDDGWEIAKDTWPSGGARLGGGIWTQPAIDPGLGLLYVNASNPAIDYDGSARHGINLFTNSVLALQVSTGKLVWHYQTIHHDIWDYDMATGPLLFDVTAGGRTVKGIASLGKTCYAYIWDRMTGTPLNPMVETAVPTTTDVPGEQVWPTQPIPYTARGVPQTPFCATYPIVSDPELAKRVRPTFHPYLVSEFVITAPAHIGGANWGSPSFSPRTGLIYATGKSDAHSLKPKPVGNTLSDKPGPHNLQHLDVSARGPTGVKPNMNVGAYEPVSGDLVWHTELPGSTNSGSLATAGDLVFQGVGSEGFYALDARTGDVLFRSPDVVRASPLSYMANGQQFVAVVATNKVLAFALPAR
jgi:quinoprotein glucose dehydrogenase